MRVVTNQRAFYEPSTPECVYYHECSFSKRSCWPLQGFSTDAAMTRQIFASLHLEWLFQSLSASHTHAQMKMPPQILKQRGSTVSNDLPTFYYHIGFFATFEIFPSLWESSGTIAEVTSWESDKALTDPLAPRRLLS